MTGYQSDWVPVMTGYQSDWIPVMTGYPVRLDWCIPNNGEVSVMEDRMQCGPVYNGVLYVMEAGCWGSRKTAQLKFTLSIYYVKYVNSTKLKERNDTKYREVRRSTEKYREVRRSTKKYRSLLFPTCSHKTKLYDKFSFSTMSVTSVTRRY
jgi:hypothetical protein